MIFRDRSRVSRGIRRPGPRRPGARLLALAVVGAALAAAPVARADTFTFVGAHGPDWSYRLDGLTNWQDNAYPTGASYADDYLLGLATSTGRLASSMNYSSWRLRRLSFDGKGGVDLTGNEIRVAGGGTIAVTSAADHTMTNAIVLNGNGAASNAVAVDVVTSASLAASGAWSGSGALVKTGAGTLTLSGANSYTGGTTIKAGTIRAGSNGALAAGDLTLAGGNLDLNGSSPTVNNLNLGDGATSGNLGTVTGSGTLNVNGSVAYKPFLSFSNPALVGLALSLSAGQHAFSSTGYSNTTAYAEVFSGAISGAGGIDKSGVAFLALNAANSYAGATNLNGGFTYLGAAGALPTNTALSVASGARLYLNPAYSQSGVVPGSYSQTVGSLAGAGTVSLGAATLTVGGLNTNTEFSGSLSGTDGKLVKTGAGTLTLSGTNAYTGGTTVSGGRLVDQKPHGSYVTNAALEFRNESDLTYATPITGTGSFAKSGAGVLTLSGKNTYAGGTTVASGTIRAGSDEALGGGDLTLLSGSLDLNGHTATIGSLVMGSATSPFNTGVGTVSGPGTLRLNGNLNLAWPDEATVPVKFLSPNLILSAGQHTFGGTDADYGGRTVVLSGAGGLDVIGRDNGVVLTGNSTYTGATNVVGGTLVLGATNALPADTALGVFGSDRSRLHLYNDPYVGSVPPVSYSQTVGSLSGSGSIDLGSATLTVGGLNTDTTFSAGLYGRGGQTRQDGHGHPDPRGL